MKKILILLLAVAFVFVATSCAVDTKSEAPEAAPLKVATSAAGPPYTFLDVETQEVEGLMIDIIEELSDRIGTDIVLEVMDWSALIPSLEGGKVDVISDGMYITDERKQVIDFTAPVFGFGEGIAVYEDDIVTQTLDDLAGKTAGTLIATVYHTLLEERGTLKEIKVYKTIGEILMDLDARRIDAAVADEPILIYLKSQNPGYRVKIVEDYEPVIPGEVGIGVSKDNPELLEKLNVAIEEIKADGSLQAIYDKWDLDWDY